MQQHCTNDRHIYFSLLLVAALLHQHHNSALLAASRQFCQLLVRPHCFLSCMCHRCLAAAVLRRLTPAMVGASCSAWCRSWLATAGS
jgi:hypothetical protein